MQVIELSAFGLENLVLTDSIEGEFEFSTPVDPGIYGKIFGVRVNTYACPNFRA